MSDRVTIAAEPRTVTGKKVKQLRRQGYVPGVIYGQSDPVNIQMEYLQLNRALRVAGMHQLATVDVAGKKKYTVLAREIQQHVVRRDVLHVDFLEVSMTETITSEAALVMVGEAPVLDIAEGMIAQSMFSIEIECLPDDLVSEIEVDISKIETTSDSVLVSDLKVPQGITLLAEADATVARFQSVRAEVEEEEEEESFFEEGDAGDVEVVGQEEAEDFE